MINKLTIEFNETEENGTIEYEGKKRWIALMIAKTITKLYENKEIDEAGLIHIMTTIKEAL